MIGGMVLAWSIYYAVSKVVVGATGSALLAGFLLRLSALLFLTVQLLLDGNFSRLFHQGKAVRILLMIGVFGFLLDLFANLGYQYGSLSTGTALLKTDVLMVNLVTVALFREFLAETPDWAKRRAEPPFDNHWEQGADDDPALVCWYDAYRFASWFGKKHGLAVELPPQELYAECSSEVSPAPKR